MVELSIEQYRFHMVLFFFNQFSVIIKILNKGSYKLIILFEVTFESLYYLFKVKH